nr:DNA helicase [Tanacetum cinerariifolium]
EKINEFTNTGLTQLEKQPPDILTRTQAPVTLEDLDNVHMCYASGCNVPPIGDPTGVFVLPFGGVSASEEMLNLLGVPSADCRTDNTQLYLIVFQKCSEFCGGNLRRERQLSNGVSQKGPSTISKGTLSAADVMRTDCESQKIMPTDATDVFQAYIALCSRGIGGLRSVNMRQTIAIYSSNFIHNNGKNARGNSEVNLTSEATCSRGIGGRPSLNVRQTTTVSNSNFIHENDVRNTGPSTSLARRNTLNVRQTAIVCTSNFIHDNNVRNTSPSILRGHINTRANPEWSLTTCEATCSRGIGGRRSLNVCEAITVCGSNFIHNSDARNTGPSTSRGGRNTHVNPKGPHTLTLILETLISVIVIMGLPFEIKRFMDQYPELTASDSADVVYRVFEQKIQSFVIFLKEERIFGIVTGVLYTIDALGNIVLAFASSGIASLLLPFGRTAHSRFKLPLELTKESLCRITYTTQLGKLLADTNLIIWDETPMNGRCCFEALHRILRDIVNKPFSLFGGESVLLGGDFRQTLLVKKGASKMEIIASCISESALWPSFNVFTLKENMRLARPDTTLEERSLLNSFASWLLDIGDERTCRLAEEDPENTFGIDIPTSYCLTPDEQDSKKMLEAKVDRKWVAKTPPKMTPYAFCCISLDRKDEMAKHFDQADIKNIEQPVIIAVSSCRVSKYRVVDKVADHPCTELVEKYNPADPKKIPSEILVAQGKTGVFHFHLNTLGNLKEMILDAVFDLKKQDESTGTSAQ